MKSKLDTTKLKSDILKFFILIVSLLSLLIIIIAIYAQNLSMKEALSKHYDEVNARIDEVVENHKESMVFLLKRLTYTSGIAEQLKTNQREKIYEILKPKFDILKEENPYLEIMHIVDAGGKSFLRVHNKDEFGDYLGDFRPMIKSVITNKKLIFGYETGRHGTMYRVIMPIFDGDTFLGSIEVGVNPHYFIHKLNKTLSDDGALFIHKDNLKLFASKSNISINDYLLQGNMSQNEQKILKLLPKDYTFQKTSVIRNYFHFFSIHTHSIKMFEGSEYAHYIFTHDITDLYKNYALAFAYVVLALIFCMTLMFYIIKYYLNRFNTKIIKMYMSNLKNINFAKKYLSAVENSSSNIILSFQDYQLHRANDTFYRVTGFFSIEAFELKHDCISDVFIPKEGYLGNFENDKELYLYLKNAPGKIHKAILNKDDKEIISLVELNDFTLDEKKRYMLTFSDITEFENIQKQFIEAQEIAHIGSWELFLNEGKLMCSDEMHAIFEVEKYTINFVKDFKILVHPEDLKRVEVAYFESLKYKTSYQVTYRIITQNGEKIKYVEERGKHQVLQNSVISTGTVQDITEQIELKEEIKKQQELVLAQSRHAAMGEMISMIAHQWRQPLSVIAMGANNIIADVHLETVTNESLMESSEEILEETQYLSQTIEDFRNFFKPSHGLETIALRDIFKDTYKIIGKSLSHANIQLVEDINCDKVIETYARELMQVFINLLKNAKEALVEHKEENRKIEVTCSELEDRVMICFQDNAGGIKDDIIAKVFDPYFSTKDEKVGTGLGLYMSKTIVEKHLQGTIRVRNSDDGVLFEIILPLKIGQWDRRKRDG